MYNFPWNFNTIQSFRKNLMDQFQENTRADR